MARKVFLSFLGTGDYVPCHYYTESEESKKSSLSKYVQTALIELYGKDFSDEDQFFFFVTKDAMTMNWKNNGQYNRETGRCDKENKGLEQRIEELDIKSDYKPEMIPEGFSTDEIWEIFEIVNGCIDNDVEVYLDITHAFRSIPMLGMALLNYLKIVKNIKVKGVFYGAFEKLGRPQEVSNMKEKERLAPIINLLTFSELQDWTLATNSFVRYGKTDQLKNIGEAPLIELAREFKGKEKSFNTLRKIFKALNSFSNYIETNRGLELKGFYFGKLKNQIDEVLKSGDIYLPAYQANLETIRNRIEMFDEKDPLNFINTVQWSKENGMLQQAITQLKEGITTYFAQKYGKDYIDEDIRRNVDKALYSLKDKNRSSQNYLFGNPLEEDEEAKALSEGFKNFSVSVRNDINHNGMRNGASQFKKLREQFDDFFIEVNCILKNNTSIERKAPPTTLLNLSNHPSGNWPQNQKESAIKKYGEIQDLPFPQIDPKLSEAELAVLVNEYVEQIRESNPKAVHIMGEMTFTYRLVHKLKEIGIPCIASTTERKVTEDENGIKTSQFNFVKFRSY